MQRLLFVAKKKDTRSLEIVRSGLRRKSRAFVVVGSHSAAEGTHTCSQRECLRLPRLVEPLERPTSLANFVPLRAFLAGTL